MGEPAKRQFALDVNVLLDRANNEHFAVSFLRVFTRRRYSFFATHTVLPETELLTESPDLNRAKAAIVSLENLRTWGIPPLDVPRLKRDYCFRFAEDLIRKGWLPEDEKNHAVILAEAAVNEIPFLVTSDRDLLDISLNHPLAELKGHGLYQTLPIRPKHVLERLG